MIDSKQDDSKAKALIAELYSKVIKNLGYDSVIDPDGDVTFQNAEGLHFVAIIDANHKQFVRLAIPGIYEAAKSSRISVLEACNTANRQSKGVKVYVPQSARFVWVAYEVILDDLGAKDLEHTIDIGMTLLIVASRRFLKNIEEAG